MAEENKISDIISYLNKLKDKHGDLVVCTNGKLLKKKNMSRYTVSEYGARKGNYYINFY